MLFITVDSISKIEFLDHPLELRLDLFSRINLEEISKFIKSSKNPILLTLRRSEKRSESERRALILKLLDLNPTFFDLECDIDSTFLSNVITKYPNTKFILSYHNFEKIPDNLDDIYKDMKIYPAESYKIAVMVHSSSDALKLLAFNKDKPNLSLICMGEKGSFSRVLAPIFNQNLSYAYQECEKKIAPGQVSLKELLEIYNFTSLNSETEIFALIGNPVDRSLGHFYHNAKFNELKKNRVYVKIELEKEELISFFKLCKIMPMIKGLSVTHPFKEAVFPLIDEMDEASLKIGAINTILFLHGKIMGTNTDGVGALDAIEKKIQVMGKKVVIVGAGGASRAIAFEAKRRGANVLVLNRTFSKAKELSVDIGCDVDSLDHFPQDYDILINTTPSLEPIDLNLILEKKVVMDIIYNPKETPLILKAKEKLCQIVYGEEMFFNQAERQTQFWN